MTNCQSHGGPLTGLRVVEFAGLGPVPHGAMILADLGADVVLVVPHSSRALDLAGGRPDHVLRNRSVVRADLKAPRDLAAVRELLAQADVAVEGMRPGTMERLGLGPDECCAENIRLVYARMTGWGQEGALAARAGHDINYIGITGALAAIGTPAQPPTVPLNLVGDYGGGSMLMVIGVLAALHERETSGRGQVIDVAMVDGAALLTQLMWAMRGYGEWSAGRGTNLIDGGAPFYSTYRCADGGYVAVGALEPQFYRALLAGLELDESDVPDRDDRAQWPALRECFAREFSRRPRAEWEARFAGTDACVTPVLDFEEVAGDSYLRDRGTIIDVAGVTQAAPAPRFSRTPTSDPRAPGIESDAAEVLARWTRPGHSE
ncbi:CaiB/BaiF CoA-transferase family protein [Tsukamurella sp. PLM1]|uniref:CaiB/BaiF CoA transferase family protein n=1 Tax=Tsukamurella sp. PLM1 TaxID=2929795 RepID=UPI00206C6B27|nr:CaiB/BaiF CoA-transferase family protein [Tsukamurella sp. PLM1]BDH59660.1 alpha-methylacyl-CoA racemase [Tsukamurella sp. PLM1]